jgi:hypothetical protein
VTVTVNGVDPLVVETKVELSCSVAMYGTRDRCRAAVHVSATFPQARDRRQSSQGRACFRSRQRDRSV